ncbi:hypothetical protein LIER_27524 [Lithospermum erythrorhizon]|uniref:Uncharacterized protein n=1 Tax=Lithospermum erythrorhizon TaxID=34254 RepID=A0AAV3RDJ5_LITER
MRFQHQRCGANPADRRSIFIGVADRLSYSKGYGTCVAGDQHRVGRPSSILTRDTERNLAHRDEAPHNNEIQREEGSIGIHCRVPIRYVFSASVQ